ncbi:transposase [Nitratireductor soli]|uniref:transposase n=1 Tax=Nitratireductor soli TaxID=1670619 RepID=UPI00313A4D5B
MSTQRFTPEFKEEAVRQVVERGYGVPDVGARLGVSAHSLYKWASSVWIAPLTRSPASSPSCSGVSQRCLP